MCTSMFVVAITASLLVTVPQGPKWQTDYYAARERVTEGGKPLAVFIGSGKAGWHNVCQDGKLSEEVSKILASDYVCLYVDVDKPAGRRLAAAFDIAAAEGLVISDQSGRLQAFRHDGNLADEELHRHLRHYADPDHVVVTTETPTVQQFSDYSWPSTSYQGYMQPAYYPSFSRGGCRT
jgi:hypothetical protein